MTQLLGSSKPSPQAGFTLIELMVTVAVIAILAAVAVPSFTGLMARSRLLSQSNEVVASLKLARSEAGRRGIPVAIRSTAGTSAFGGGWTVFTNSLGDGVIPGTVTANNGTPLQVIAVPAGITVTRVTTAAATVTASGAGSQFVVFNARGGTTASFFRICSSLVPATRGRVVQVSTVGKVSMVAAGATCP